MPCITDMLERCHGNNRVQLTDQKQKGDLITIAFAIRGNDGTTMAGHRTFHRSTTFLDMEDFEDELWKGELFDVVPVPRTAGLRWALVLLLIGATFSVLVSDGVPLSLSVCLGAALLGERYALVLAAINPFLYNLVVIPPALEFNTPTAHELARGLFGVAVALLIPTLTKYRGAVLRWVKS